MKLSDKQWDFLNQKINGFIESHNMTQQEFASLVGITWVTVSRWRNKHHRPTGASLKLAMNILDISEKEIKSVEGEREWQRVKGE